jgi:hypothetical protein
VRHYVDERQRSVRAALFIASIAALWASGTALAAGGDYVFQGGTPYQQQQVRQALQASSFNWSIVPSQITITIGGTPSQALPGQIWLDATLLDAGEFSWGVVQHEYAHQVDFALLDDANHAKLNTLLGGTTWCYDGGLLLQHNQYGCERFASTLAWAYWPSPDNCMKPSQIAGESGAIAPAAFRNLLSNVLGQRAAAAPLTDTALPAHAPTVRRPAGTREAAAVAATLDALGGPHHADA